MRNLLKAAAVIAVFAATAGAAGQGINISFDNASGRAPDFSADVPAPAAVTPPAPVQQYPAQETAAWDGYFRQLGAAVKQGGLKNAGMNNLTLLVDGQEVINSVVPDIKNARLFIHIEIFAWQADEIGAMFRDLLAEKVKAGVRVRVILDSYGSEIKGAGSPGRMLVDSMLKAGIDVRVRSFELLHLDHRKVMVLDDGNGGLLAYTGGMNIGDHYQRIWHDQQTRVSGLAVRPLHQSFLEDWAKVAGEELTGFPAAQPAEGGVRTYVVTHVGGSADRNIKQAYLLAINTARQLIRIEDPYFTDNDVISALIKAASDPLRPGLKVQLVVPALDNKQSTLRSFRSHYPAMLKAGIEIYEYQPRMEHLKAAVMDHVWSTVGSSNLDAQSMRYNNEMNLLVLDKDFAGELDRRIFDNDIAQSVRITGYKPNLGDAVYGHLPFL